MSRNRQEAPQAPVVRVQAVERHPNADRLDVLTLWTAGGDGLRIVTGRHYRANMLGVWLPPGTLIPGYLACDLWLSKKGEEWFEVREIEIRGVPSPGLFAGQSYLPDRDDPRSVERAKTQPEADEFGWLRWRLWRDHWKVGDNVAAYLGVTCPLSSVAEQPVLNRQVAAKTPAHGRPLGPHDAEVEASGSTPAAGSTPLIYPYQAGEGKTATGSDQVDG